MTTARLYRHHESEFGTFGVFAAPDYSCLTLELPWRDNQQHVSCIPLDVYNVRWVYSDSWECFTYRLADVPNRDGILIHPANTISELRGCIAPGLTTFQFVDGAWGVASSRDALSYLELAMDNQAGERPEWQLEIIGHQVRDAYPRRLSNMLDDLLAATDGVPCAEVYGGIGPILV